MTRIPRAALVIFAGAAIVVADLILLWIGTRADFAFDFTCCYQQAGQRALTDPSTLYAWSADYTFRYTPLGALAFSPLAGLTQSAATWAFVGLKLVVLAIVALWYSQPWRGRERILVALLVLTFPPIVHDIVIGNISTFTTLVLLALLRWPSARGGAVLGVMLALAPKPHLIPVLIWLAFRRRGAFVASMATALALVLIGILALGPGPWLAFLATLREPLSRAFTANVGFSAYLGMAGVLVGVVSAGALLYLGLLRRESDGMGLAILSGIVLGPYSFIHYLSGALIAVEPILRSRPRWLVAFPWLLIAFPLIPIWVLLLGLVEWRLAAAEGQPAAAPS
jgi:hypothetical protein